MAGAATTVHDEFGVDLHSVQFARTLGQLAQLCPGNRAVVEADIGARPESITLNESIARQVGRLSFFKNAANRGSLCKLFSRGSTFIAIRLGSR